jgi:hypothetical protein
VQPHRQALIRTGGPYLNGVGTKPCARHERALRPAFFRFVDSLHRSHLLESSLVFVEQGTLRLGSDDGMNVPFELQLAAWLA